MRKTKKALASLAIAGMVLSMAPMSVFGATTSTRLAGDSRIDTAISIAANGWTTSDSVIVVPADDANIVDALAAAPLAGQLNAPILVTYKGALDPKVQQKIVDLKAKNVYAIGALSTDAVASLKAISGVTVTQLQGADRTETAAKVAAQLTSVKGTFVVAYDGSADALSAASYAAANGYSIVLANPDGTIPASEKVTAPVYTVGGQVSYTGATKLAGADRYATNDAVNNGLTFQYDKVYVANGETLVDALAGASLAAKTKSPIVLADATHAATGVNDNLTATSQVVALGGVGAVSDSVLGQVAYQAPATLAVSSVTAINAKQVEVKFNKAVDKDSATDKANYSIQRNGDSSAVGLGTVDGTVGLELKDDQQTVVITATTDIATTWGVVKGTAFNFIVNQAGVKDADGTALGAKSTTLLVNNDTTAPTLVSVTSVAATSTKKVTVKFSEPVNYSASGVFVVNGKTAAVAAGSDNNSVELTAQDNLVAGQSYTLTITNLKDYAGNLTDVNPLTQTFTVVSDTVNQGVSSLTTSGDNKVNVVFAEKMDSATVTNATINVLDGNGNSVGAVYSVGVTTGDTTGTKYTITFTNASIFNSNGVANLQIVFTSNIKDMASNQMTAVTQSATLTKDTVKPSISTVTYVKANGTYDGATYTTGGAFVVTASEKLKTQTTLARTNVTVIDQDGTDITSTIFTADPIVGLVADSNDSTKIVIPLAAAMPTTVKTATIHFAAGAFTDASLGANASTAGVVGNVDITNGIGALTDIIKPSVTSAAGVTGASNVLTITYNITEANLDTASVQNISNYRLDGAVLPADTYVTIAGTAPNYTVTIHLPQNSVTETKTNYAFTISGIKDTAGNTASTLAVSNVSLTDNTQPVLTAGKINSDGTITATFSENVTSGAALDFNVKMNGSAAIDASQLVVSNITSGADNGGQLIQVKVAFDAGTAGASTGDETIYVDVNNSGTLDAGDITIATGSYANAAAYNGGYVKASDFSTLSVGTKATGTLSGIDAASNALKNNVTVTVK